MNGERLAAAIHFSMNLRVAEGALDGQWNSDADAAVVGVYSVVSYAAAQRTREIGIRMALGAAPRDILKMVLRQSIVVVGVGLTIGLATALAGTRAIANLIVGVRPTDPLTFISVVLLLSAISLLACWIPARRATRIDPLTALRYE